MNEQWVPYKLKSGKILYHINAVTGECRWTNQLRKINPRPQRRLDKICSMWNVKKLRWRDIRAENNKENNDEQTGSLEAECLDDNDKGASGDISMSHDAAASGLDVETAVPSQVCLGCGTSEPRDSGYSLSVFHNLIQQVLDNQHTIYEKLQQIEGQMSQHSTMLRTPSVGAKNRSSSSSSSTKHCKMSNGTTVVWPEGTNVFMQSGSPSTEKKTVEKKSTVEKTNVKKLPSKKISQSLELSQETLDELKKQAKSQVNFSVKLLTRLTSVAERSGKAVYGNRNKPSLDPETVSKIRKYYFHVFPGKNKEDEWARCVSAMNLHLRKMKK